MQQLYVPTNQINSRCPLLNIQGNLEFSIRVPLTLHRRPDDSFYVTRSTDTLYKLAYRFYRDIRLWWVLYDANAELIDMHPLDMPAGITLRVPSAHTVEMELLNAANV